MDFWRAVGILNNRKWLIILSVIAATTLTWGATRLVGAKWVAEVKFMAIGSSPIAGVMPKAGDAVSDAAPTERGSQRDRDNAMLAQIQAVMLSEKVVTGALASMSKVRFPNDLLDRIEIVKAGPGVFAMRYTDSSQNRAKVVANAMAKSFVDRYQQILTEKAKGQVDILDAQVKTAEANLAEARRKYDTFRSARQISGTGGSDVDVALRRVTDAEAQLSAIRQRLADAQAQIRVKEQELLALPATIKQPDTTVPSTLIPDLKKQIAEKNNQLRPLELRYSSTHPQVKNLKDEIAALQAQLDSETRNPTVIRGQTLSNPARDQVARDINNLKSTAAGYAAQLPGLQANVNVAQRALNTSGSSITGIGAMATDISQAQDVLTNLRAQLHAAQLRLDAAQAQQPIVIADEVSDNFNPPMSATKGRTLKLILLAFLGALIGTCAIVIALDSVDRRVKTVGQANMALPARIIAAIPQPMGNVSYSNLARATEVQPSSLHSEAYRFLGLHLLSPRGPKVRSLMVLSAKAEQGSTTTVTNLAITLAQAGKKVILVDANVRTAELHQVFETPNQFGFTDLLRDPSLENLERALTPTNVANLQIITSGPMTDNAWQLFRSDSLVELSRRLHERADFVLYDTPSALIFTDALNLAPVVDAAFLCVRALEPLTGAEQRVVELLEQSNVTVLGSVLNDVPAAVVEGYHNYQHYYGGPAAMPAIAGRGGDGGVTPLIEMPKTEAGGRKNGAG